MGHLSQNKGVALVTGAAKRIGRAIALGLAEQNYALALHTSAASVADAQELANLILGRGGRAQVFVADLAAEDIGTLVDEVVAACGALRLLVNNASLFVDDRAETFHSAQWDQHFAVNLRAPALLAQKFAAQVEEGAQASIINIIDQRVLRPNPQFFSYTLTKSALWTMTQTLAQAFAPRIRVNAIGPGPVLPNETQGAEGFSREVAGVPLQRAVEPADIVAGVLYLASARSVTGQFLAVDSGQHLGWRTPDIVE